MSDDSQPRPVERLFPFVLRSGILVVGREALRRRRSRLAFVLMTTDLSANSRAEILREFAHCPVVQHYVSADLETHFNVRNAKVLGFARSGLARSIYAELKTHRVPSPPDPPKASGSAPVPPGGHGVRSGSTSPRRDRP